MASGLFTSAKNILWGSGATRLDFDTDDIRAILFDAADDTIDLGVDDFLDDLAAAGRVAVSGALASKTITAGTIDAADVTWTSVSGDTSEQVVLYKHTGTESTSSLFLLFDAGGFTSGMPVTPNGGNIVLTFNASGIASL